MSTIEDGPTAGEDRGTMRYKPWPINSRDTAIIVAWFVVGLCLCATYFPSWIALSDESLDARGSTVAALFSGLAFVAVVLTLFDQRQELRLQREELELTRNELSRSATAQEQTSKQNRAASQRQTREQFLTARLNATSALLQACQARAAYLSDDDRQAVIQGQHEALKLTHQVSILLCEAEMGFDDEMYDLEWHYTRAIRAYIKRFFSDMLDRCLLPESDGRRLRPLYLDQEAYELRTLCELVHAQDQTLALLAIRHMQHLRTLESVEQAAHYLRQVILLMGS